MNCPAKVPKINTERLRLRGIVQEDLENVYRGLSNPDVTRFYGVSFTTRNQTQEQMNWYSDHMQNNTGRWWAIRAIGNFEFLGAAGINDINHDHRKAELGVWLRPEYWGKGIAIEALIPILDHAFNKLNLHRIEGFVETKNLTCIRLLNKIGFRHEGTMNDCEIKNEAFISLEIFAMLATHFHNTART